MILKLSFNVVFSFPILPIFNLLISIVRFDEIIKNDINAIKIIMIPKIKTNTIHNLLLKLFDISFSIFSHFKHLYSRFFKNIFP